MSRAESPLQSPSRRPPTPASGGHPALPWLAAVGVMVLWASSFIVIRAGGVHLSPGPMSLLRIASATVAALPLVATGRVRRPSSAGQWWGTIAWGVAWFAGYTVALNTSERTVDAATAAMLVNVAPLLVAVVSGLLMGEGLPLRLVAGVLVAFAGVGLITLATSTGQASTAGLVLGLVAALLYAACVLGQKRLLDHVDATSMTVVGIVAGLVALLPFGPQLARELGSAPLSSVLAVVYMGVLPTTAAFLLWGYALSRTPAGVLTSSSLVVPAIALVMAWLLLGETPPPLAAAGGVLCLVGAGFAIVPSVLGSLRRRG